MTSAIVLFGEFPFMSNTWFMVVVVPGSPAAPVGFLRRVHKSGTARYEHVSKSNLRNA